MPATYLRKAHPAGAADALRETVTKNVTKFAETPIKPLILMAFKV